MTISACLVVGHIVLILCTIAIFIFVCWLTYKHYQYTAVLCETYDSCSSISSLSSVNETASSLLLQPTEPLVRVEQVIVQQVPETITLDTKPDERPLIQQTITGRVY